MSEALQPVNAWISATDFSSRSSNWMTSRSGGRKVSRSLPTISWASSAWPVSAGVTPSSNFASDSVRSAHRSSGRSRWARSRSTQVLTAMRATQCSNGVAPRHMSRPAKSFMNTSWARSSSLSRRGRWARTILSTSGYKCATRVRAASSSPARMRATHSGRLSGLSGISHRVVTLACLAGYKKL